MARPINTHVWVVVSASGHLAAYLGYSLQKSKLAQRYRRAFGHSLAKAGYRLAYVRVTEDAPPDIKE
jgi:hypothetical protein